jgi:hypothetical protein
MRIPFIPATAEAFETLEDDDGEELVAITSLMCPGGGKHSLQEATHTIDDVPHASCTKCGQVELSPEDL